MTIETTSALDRLFEAKPYELSADEKRKLFLLAMNESFQHHVIQCPPYQRYCARRGVGLETQFTILADIPFLPVQAFKEFGEKLVSVESAQRIGRLQSSATSGIPSTVVIDKTTSKRQIRALAAVISEALGAKRRQFLILDVDPRTGNAAALGARNAAVRGFLNLASKATYFVESDSIGALALQRDDFVREIESLPSDQPVTVFGFTFVLYAHCVAPLLKEGFQFRLPEGSKVVHIGGWKKLEDQKVSKDQFAADVSSLLGVDQRNVVDFYGFTEQMGVTYPDGPDGNKVTPAFSEVIVRDADTLEPVPDGNVGLLEFLTPIPHSYPGIAVLTDDLGVVLSREDPQAGWLGTRFKVLGRAKNAEVRGCGDIMGDKVVQRQRPNIDKSAAEEVRLLFDVEGLRTSPSLTAEVTLQSLPVVDLNALADRLLSARSKLDSYTIDELIALISAAASRWLDPESPLAPLRQQGLLFLSNWCESRTLRAMADRSLRGERAFVDGFRPLDGTNRRLMKAVPKGLVAHWLAGNVPLLGMLSLVQAILCKNANLLKAASSFSSVLPMLLDSFRGLEVKTRAGRVLRGDDILASIAVVYFPRADHKSAQRMSRAADVRLAWGGREAVEAVTNLEKKYSTEDIVFGPKVSFMVIGRDALGSDYQLRRLSRRAATDASVFDQYACASPHTIFVETGGVASPRDFARQLAQEMAKACVRIPKGPVDAGTAGRIASARLRYEFEGELWCSRGTEWTVLYDEVPDRGLAEPFYSRVVTVRAIDDVMDVVRFADDSVQTVGLALDPRRMLEFASRASIAGVERFPNIGRMTFFDTPWDGYFAMDRCVRWVTLGGPL